MEVQQVGLSVFDALLAEIASLNRPCGQLWFRGQSDDTWDLTPRLLRSPHGSVCELPLCTRFRLTAMSMVPAYQAVDDPARWLFLMQHYGLPTRLLDWTESALAAVYFAVTGNPDKDGAIYLLAPAGLNAQQTNEPVLFVPASKRVQDMMHACIQGSEMAPETIALLAYASNERIARQQGHFTLHGTPQDMRELAAPDWLRTILIPASKKIEVRSQLAYFGITRTSLFNDLDSLASDLREQYGLT